MKPVDKGSQIQTKDSHDTVQIFCLSYQRLRFSHELKLTIKGIDADIVLQPAYLHEVYSPDDLSLCRIIWFCQEYGLRLKSQSPRAIWSISCCQVCSYALLACCILTEIDHQVLILYKESIATCTCMFYTMLILSACEDIFVRV